MNIGNVPGYYYDEEKKKYFKIQANHAVPMGAKYSQSSVKREKYAVKKRKLEHRIQEASQRQTVKRSRVLQHPLLSGAGLRRELADQPSWRGDAAVAYGLGACDPVTHGSSAYLCDAVLLEKHIICAQRYKGSVYPLTLRHIDDPSSRAPGCRTLACYGKPLVAISTQTVAPGTKIVACPRDAADQCCVSIFYIHDIPPFPPDSPTGIDPPAYSFVLGKRPSLTWASCINPSTGDVAIATSAEIYILEADTELHYAAGRECESRALDWLDPHVLAYGQTDAKKVMLWDARNYGTAARFTLKHEVTGVRCPDDTGVHLLISDNHQLGYFDTRWDKQPILSFPHMHEGPQLEFAVDPSGSLVAAEDNHQQIDIFSLRSGTRVGTLPSEKVWMRGPGIHGMRWHEDVRGRPEVYGCRSGKLMRWTWGVHDDD